MTNYSTKPTVSESSQHFLHYMQINSIIHILFHQFVQSHFHLFIHSLNQPSNYQHNPTSSPSSSSSRRRRPPPPRCCPPRLPCLRRRPCRRPCPLPRSRPLTRVIFLVLLLVLHLHIYNCCCSPYVSRLNAHWYGKIVAMLEYT